MGVHVEDNKLVILIQQKSSHFNFSKYVDNNLKNEKFYHKTQ